MHLEECAHNSGKDKDSLGFSSLGLRVLLMAGSMLWQGGSLVLFFFLLLFLSVSQHF